MEQYNNMMFITSFIFKLLFCTVLYDGLNVIDNKKVFEE